MTTTKKPLLECQRRAVAKYKKEKLFNMQVKREIAERVREWGNDNDCKSWNDILEKLLDR